MSANNAIYVVDEGNGDWTVWYDGCVDNPFPQSASQQGSYSSEAEASEAAFDLMEKCEIVEYGVSRIKAPWRTSV